MVLRISGKNVDIGQALRQRIDETISAAVHKYFNGGYSGQITVSRSGRAFDTDCTLHLDTGIVFEARGSDMDAHLSFDQAAEKLDKRLRRYKRRLKDYKKTQSEQESEVASYVLAAPADEDEIDENYAPAIIAETRLDIPTIAVSTAVMQLDRTDAPVVIFRNPSHGGVNVVYRRTDGHFGWVDPVLTDGVRNNGKTSR